LQITHDHMTLTAAALNSISEERSKSPHSSLQLTNMFQVSYQI
jgi:hypothetical protein